MSSSDLTLPRLKEELKKLGLPVSGTKKELLARLRAAENVDSTDAASTEPATKKLKQSGAQPKSEPVQTLATAIVSSVEIETGGDLLGTLKEQGWRTHLAAEFNKPYFKKIVTFLDAEAKQGKQIFPPRPEIFAAFNYTPWDNLKAVIIGQDPYHDDNQAHGLCFSVKKGIKPPPSLKNIYKELERDIPGFKAPTHGNLEKWARDGVLMLNATLTVEAHKANSHSSVGWLTFTESVIRLINEKHKGIVFILWGGFAQKHAKCLDRSKHFIIEAAHPSPLSAKKFENCKCFSAANKLLTDAGKTPIDWTLPATI